MGKRVAKGDVLLGKYTVERILGQGGMGYVVAARHHELHELFAIKLMLPAAAANDEASARFIREARAAARLKSDHVAHVHDVGRLESGEPYMVMEYLTGRDLKDHLKARGVLPLNEVLSLMLETCEPLAEAHSIGIVHRDLKPANLFLFERQNVAPVVKVLDFGISKNLSMPGQEGTNLTDTGAFMGSPSYMSPEQMADGKSTDPRSDIWSLGIVFFELLTGRLPFEAIQLTEIVVQVLNEPTPSALAIRRDLPRSVDAIINKCLAKNRENRYQSVEELMGALRRLASEIGASPAKADSTPFDRTERVIPPTLLEKPDAAPSASQETGEWAAPDEPPPALPMRKSGAALLLPGVVALASLAWVGTSMMNKPGPQNHLVEPQSAVDQKEEKTIPAQEPAGTTATGAMTATPSAIASNASPDAGVPSAPQEPRAAPFTKSKPPTKPTATQAGTGKQPVIPGFNE